MSCRQERTIRLYHGPLPKKLEDILNSIACIQERDEDSKTHGDTWFYDGSLDEFAAKWPALFSVWPESGDIYVTQHNSWGSR